MSRARVSTTVDEALLAEARRIREGVDDASLLDEALTELIRRHRAAEIDPGYAAAYEKHPFDEPDEWGYLASWGEAVGRHRDAPEAG